MRAGLVLCALLGCLAAASAGYIASTPYDSSVGYVPAASSPEWMVVTGPASSVAADKVQQVAAPGPAQADKPGSDQIPPFLPTTSFSNTSAQTNASFSALQEASSNVSTNSFAISKGKAEAWAYGKGSVQHGVAVCGQAVANAFTNTCGKGNSVVAISAAAEVCANAVVKAYVDSLVKLSATTSATSSGDAAATARITAEQAAEAIAHGVALATAPCATAAAYVRSRAFSSALVNVSITTHSFGVMAAGGVAWTQATGMAQAMAYGYAKVLSQAMAKACACSNCGCQFTPKYYTDAAFSNTAGTTAQGKYALLTAVGNAGAQFCKGGSMQASVNSVLDTTVKVYANVLTQLNTLAKIDTKGSIGLTCSRLFATGAASAVAEAMGDALAGAVVVNFQQSCGWALNGLSAKAMTAAMAKVITDAASETCATVRPYSGRVGSTETTINIVNTKVVNSPVAKALAKAFSILKNKCKCEGNCWCSNGARCSPMKTCPAFVEVATKYQPPCTGYACPPSPAPVPAPVPVPSPCIPGDYQKPCPQPPPSPSPTWSAYGSSQAPL